MLRSLTIKNYALIEDIHVDLDEGLTVITGETGAGKSILLGALGLLMGQRADLSVSRDSSVKCVIEGSFDVATYHLQTVFNDLDLDYEHPTIMRRELLPSGKSRAFVNDTPVSLQQMKQVSARLIHIHSQHQTLELTTERFQLELLDAVAGNEELLAAYRDLYGQWKQTEARLKKLKEDQLQAKRELDYHEFLYKELEQQDLAGIDQQELEESVNRLQHAERILEALGTAGQLLETEQHGAMNILRQVRSQLATIEDLNPQYRQLYERLESSLIELDDISLEIGRAAEGLEANPARLAQLQSQLNDLYRLQQKHQVDTVDGLLAVQQELWSKVAKATDADGTLDALEENQKQLAAQCKAKALQLHKSRTAIVPELEKHLSALAEGLGMPQARFQFVLQPSPQLRTDGSDKIVFLFSANPGSQPGPIGSQASGGELSRIMLAVKSILAQHQDLPTLVLDEIDTGVSGAIAVKMAEIMKGMAKGMQLIAVTHLAQLAAQGKTHFKVYKEVGHNKTTTHIKALDHQQRIAEIALMIGGASVSESALAHARQLLN